MNFPLLYPMLTTWAQTLMSPDGVTEAAGPTCVRAGTAWGQETSVCEVSVVTVETLGLDFESYAYDAASDSMISTAEGGRRLIVEFRFTSIYQDAAETAQYMLCRLRDRAFRDSSRALLKSDNLSVAVAAVSPLRALARTDENGHTISVATVEVTFNAYAEDSDGAQSLSYIAAFDLSSAIDGSLRVTTTMSFDTVHFNIGKLGSPSVAATPGVPDLAALSVFGQISIASPRVIAYVSAHGIQDLGSGSMSFEFFRRRSGLMTSLGPPTLLVGGSGDYAETELVPVGTLANLVRGDYLFAQLASFTGGGGYDGITLDIHFAG